MENAEQGVGRRQVLKASGPVLATGLGAGLAGCLGDDSEDEGDRFSDAIYSTDSSFSTITFLLAEAEGIYDDYDIDMSVEVTDFVKASRAIPAGLTEINFTDLPAISRMFEEGQEVYLLDRWVNISDSLIVKKDSDIESVTDLEGKVLGMPPWGSGTTTTFGAMFDELYDFDIETDTAETIATSPPALWNLLENGDIDAMGQFTSFTLQAMGSDDHKLIFSPAEAWAERTGYPPALGIVVANKDWVDANPDYTLRWLDAYNDSLAYHKEHSDEALDRYGRLIGLAEDDGTLEAARGMFDDERIFAEGWTEDYVDSQIELFEMLVDADDGLNYVPDPEEDVLYYEDVEELAS